MVKHSNSEVEVATNVELAERRYVYGAEPTIEPTDFAPRRNRQVRHRKRSAFALISLLFAISLLIVFYVWNKITVNRLVIEVDDLQTQYQKLASSSEIIRAEINKKSSLERIGKIASEQLGLIYPKEQPVWFPIDSERLAQITQGE